MKNAIIIHGRPTKEIYYDASKTSSSNFAWIPWLQKQLIIKDIKADTPEMFLAYEPQYEIWKEEFERYEVNEETILVGHSAGGGFLLRWLSENKKIFVNKLVLVAPSVDPFEKTGLEFHKFAIDKDLSNRVRKMILIMSDKDSDGIMETANILKKTFPDIVYKEFPGYGHFIPQDMGKSEFPELLEEILR
ncbi:MAG: alpha/beta hydrolase [Candidatus Magasanikbacteria bacterium]